MTYDYIVNANTVKIIRSNWTNDTIIVTNLRLRGEARLFWANEDDIHNQTAPLGSEIQLGEIVYVVVEERKNLIILNQSGNPQHIIIDISVNPVPPSFRPISATSGF